MEIVFGLAIVAMFAYAAYELWYVPRETAKKGGSKPADHANPDKQ